MYDLLHYSYHNDARPLQCWNVVQILDMTVKFIVLLLYVILITVVVKNVFMVFVAFLLFKDILKARDNCKTYPHLC